MALPLVFVWRQRDGSWRWRYMDDVVVLTSNETYEDEGRAERAARIAYPRVRVVREDDVALGPTIAGGSGDRRGVVGALPWVAIGALLGAALAVAMEAIERRQERKKRRRRWPWR